MSNECAHNYSNHNGHNITSSVEHTVEFDSGTSLTEIDSNYNYNNDVSTLVLSTGIFLDTKSELCVVELNKLSLV